MPPRKPRRRRAGDKQDRKKREGASPAPSPVELAIRYLGPRRRFEKEVRVHLRRKGVAPAEVGRAVGRLRELSLVSDEETARAWIRDRLNFAPRGRGLLRAELLAKGVSDGVVEGALQELVGPEDEERAALDCLRRGQARWAGLPEAKARRRMWSALARRGFPPPVCRAALVRFADETGVPPGEEEWE